jgi:hypothetical protein
LSENTAALGSAAAPLGQLETSPIKAAAKTERKDATGVR